MNYWFMLLHARDFNKLCYLKETRHQKPHYVIIFIWNVQNRWIHGDRSRCTKKLLNYIYTLRWWILWYVNYFSVAVRKISTWFKYAALCSSVLIVSSDNVVKMCAVEDNGSLSAFIMTQSSAPIFCFLFQFFIGFLLMVAKYRNFSFCEIKSA